MTDSELTAENGLPACTCEPGGVRFPETHKSGCPAMVTRWQHRAESGLPACRGCGTPMSPGNPTPDHCGDCPPWTCDDCGEACSMADPCRCWISLEGLPLADIKGLLALGDLSLTLPIPPGAHQ